MKTNMVKLYLKPSTSNITQQQEIEYKLRIIGLINDEQLTNIKKDKSIVRKLLTSSTVTLETISKNRSLDNHRIVGVVHEKNGIIETTLDKIFVTEKIDNITCMNKRFAAQDSTSIPLVKLTIVGEKGTFMQIEDLD